MQNSILITGANRGLGLEFTKQYAAEGWRVFATCRNPEQALALKKLTKTFSNIQIMALDISDDLAIKKIAEELKDQSLNILLNNAGIFGPQGAHFGLVETNSWLNVLRTNTIGPLILAQALMANLLLAERKIIACMSSGLGSISMNTEGGRYPYRTSKAALNMIVKSLSMDLKDKNIIAVALSPGWVKTDMGGENATLTPDQCVSDLRKIIKNLTLKESGKFFSYKGDELPW